MLDYIDKLKKETNNSKDIIFREKIIKKHKIWIIYNEPLISSNKVSEFIVKSLTEIEDLTNKNIIESIENNIYNFKYELVNNYKEMCEYIHKGYTILLIENEETILVLETKADIKRSISNPTTENTYRGSKDSFNEDYQTNIGLIKKRIKSNDLWIETTNIGKYTNTQIGVLYINGICKKELVRNILEKLSKIEIDGIVNSGMLKNLIEKENKNPLPTTITTEKPDQVSKSLLQGKVCIVVDNDPYVLIIPSVLNDFFKTSEDYYSKGINASLTRIVKYLAFFITLFTPAIYIALITYNQEMIPTELLISFQTQRSNVPFPAFFEAFIMLISFKILRESDLRTPSFTGSSLSIVGALILGDAAVAAGIVSPILIIIIAITSISGLLFNEYEMINGIRWYQLLFMLGGTILGIMGVVITGLFFLINLCELESYGKPYLIPFVPTSFSGLKDSIIKFSNKHLTKRPRFLSNNRVREKFEK